MDEECLFPAQPISGQEKPEEPIRPPEFRPAMLSVQEGKLLAECEVFERQVRTQPQGG
jgi:hypothetical protein